MKTDFAPIALFVYNRPEHTQRTIDALKACTEAGDSELFIFSDAAKHEDAAARVNEVRRIIAETSGFRSVSIVERNSNWGLAASIIDGVSALCRDFGKAIILEDDLVVAPGFLDYMNQALAMYQDKTEVKQISGHMFPVKIGQDDDAFFLPFTTSWGWATWQRAWTEFDQEASGYDLLKQDTALRKTFDLDGAYPYFKMLEAQFEGKVDSWAIRWYLTVFLKHGLTLYPRQTLVSNTGFDGSGTHGKAFHDGANKFDGKAIRRFPQHIQVEEAQKRAVYRYLAKISGNGLMTKARIALQQKLSVRT